MGTKSPPLVDAFKRSRSRTRSVTSIVVVSVTGAVEWWLVTMRSAMIRRIELLGG